MISKKLEIVAHIHCVRRYISNKFVPKHQSVGPDDVQKLENFIRNKQNVLVLTGAGISTESACIQSDINSNVILFTIKGIPDYRSEGVGLYARSNSRPVQHLEFIQSPKVRRRYWARNFVAWPHFSNIQPNETHKALARLQRNGQIGSIVTQNVDRLHTKGGSKDVLELHGCGYKVICLGSHCDYSIDRHELQLIFNSMNKNLMEQVDLMRPDGDVDIPQEYIDSFKVPDCPKCGGMLKPEIVFFGDNVPKDRAERLANLVCISDLLLVIGSSLQVYSGYRVLLHSHDLGTPIAIVNIGSVRGEDKAQLKISAKCGDVIPKLFVSN